VTPRSRPRRPKHWLRLAGLPDVAGRRVLVIACGALVRELRATLGSLDGVEITYLPANLHNRPQQIPHEVRRIITEKQAEFDQIAVAYADCGTGGLLDAVLDEFDVQRLPGAHCYEFFTGAIDFEVLAAEELGTFFLTDFLARHFDALVMDGLGLTANPSLRDIYFANYTRVVYLAQSDSPELDAAAERAASLLGLRYERRRTGLEPFQLVLNPLVGARV
jgi:hypothetical protein